MRPRPTTALAVIAAHQLTRIRPASPTNDHDGSKDQSPQRPHRRPPHGSFAQVLTSSQFSTAGRLVPRSYRGSRDKTARRVRLRRFDRSAFLGDVARWACRVIGCHVSAPATGRRPVRSRIRRSCAESVAAESSGRIVNSGRSRPAATIRSGGPAAPARWPGRAATRSRAMRRQPPEKRYATSRASESDFQPVFLAGTSVPNSISNRRPGSSAPDAPDSNASCVEAGARRTRAGDGGSADRARLVVAGATRLP